MTNLRDRVERRPLEGGATRRRNSSALAGFALVLEPEASGRDACFTNGVAGATLSQAL